MNARRKCKALQRENAALYAKLELAMQTAEDWQGKWRRQQEKYARRVTHLNQLLLQQQAEAQKAKETGWRKRVAALLFRR